MKASVDPNHLFVLPQILVDFHETWKMASDAWPEVCLV